MYIIRCRIKEQGYYWYLRQNIETEWPKISLTPQFAKRFEDKREAKRELRKFRLVGAPGRIDQFRIIKIDGPRYVVHYVEKIDEKSMHWYMTYGKGGATEWTKDAWAKNVVWSGDRAVIQEVYDTCVSDKAGVKIVNVGGAAK